MFWNRQQRDEDEDKRRVTKCRAKLCHFTGAPDRALHESGNTQLRRAVSESEAGGTTTLFLFF